MVLRYFASWKYILLTFATPAFLRSKGHKSEESGARRHCRLHRGYVGVTSSAPSLLPAQQQHSPSPSHPPAAPFSFHASLHSPSLSLLTSRIGRRKQWKVLKTPKKNVYLLKGWLIFTEWWIAPFDGKFVNYKDEIPFNSKCMQHRRQRRF